MNLENTESLIVKFFNNECSIEELDLLLKLLDEPKNLRLFKKYVKINLFSKYYMNDIDRNDTINTIVGLIHKEKKRLKHKSILLKFSIAATIILLFGLSFQMFFNQDVKKINPYVDSVVLTTSDGKEIILNNNDQTVIDSKINLKQNDDELVYSDINKKGENIQHHLVVPYGKRFNISLSDGTKVFLNSGSSISYPAFFGANSTRLVELKGEAYFDVTEDKNSIFRVSSGNIMVEVYGTQFNLRNYNEDYFSDVVLVEGSVGIKDRENSQLTMLTPGIKGSVNKENFSINKMRVNTSVYTSWIEGNVIFRNETFSQIVQKLERLYNVTIINNKKDSDQLFNASIDVESESIEQVLDYFEEIYNVQHTFYENKIIIN
tara:strand:- start:1910 stop:3037 length:1128 start_codon:yes stop_codon:yes gene_type:complete